MEYYNNILAIDSNWLISNGIISQGNYNKMTAMKKIQVIRRGCYGTPALVSYESLPERFKSKIVEIVGNPYNTVQVNAIAELIEESIEASQYFDSFVTSEGKHLPAEKRREYYANAIILNAVHAFETQHKAKRASIGARKKHIMDFACETVQSIDNTRYPHNLPVNVRAFERKYKDYLKFGYDSLIHKTYINGNKNAAIVTEEGKAMLTMLLAHPNNFDNEQIARLYERFAEVQGIKSISSSTVAVWRDKLDSVTFARRRGSKEFFNNKTMQVTRSLPSYPLAMWTLDGWDAELFYRDDNGGTTHRVTLEVVVDPYFYYPIGYAISRPGKAESAELITRSLQNALHHTRELFGEMYQANQIQSDNFVKSAMRPFYDVAGDKYTPAKKGNAKSKVVERYFKYLNQKYCQFQSNWSGWGVTSRTAQPNYDDEVRKLRYIPTYDEVCSQIESIMDYERREKHDLYVKGFSLIPEERKLPLDMHRYLMIFGMQTTKTIMMRGEGIRLQLGGKKYLFDSFDVNFRKYSSTQWHIRYDESDMSRVVAVNEDETLQFLLEEKFVQPMALCERTEEATLQLDRVRDFNRELVEQNTKSIVSAQDRVEKILESKKELATLQKLLLTDGNGQHKNNRNRIRQEIENANIYETQNLDIYSKY